MGKIPAAFGFLILAAAGAPLHAEEFPWCVQVDVFTKNCAFAKYDECATIARNAIGPATGGGRCVANPNYQPPAATAPSKAAVKSSNKPR